MYHYLTRSKLLIEKYIELITYYIQNSFSNNLKIYSIDENYKIIQKIQNNKMLYILNFLYDYVSKVYNFLPIGLKRQLEEKGNYYCIIHNKYGICKTIFKYKSINDIFNQKDTINIKQKIDRIYENNIIEQIKLIRYNETEIEFTDLMMNIDKNLNLTLDNFFELHEIKYNQNDKLYIKYMNYMNFEEKCIVEDIAKFIKVEINNII